MIGTKPKGYAAPGNPGEVMNMGIIQPWQSNKGGNTGGSYQRMAGDYMSEFTQNNPEAKKIIEKPKYESNVMKTLGASNSTSSASSNATQPDKTVSTVPSPVKPAPAQNNVPTMAGPKSGKYYADHAEVKAAWNAKYDENQYKYYRGKDGVSTGADAYHTDMANYQAQMKTMGDNPHLGLVNQMMHPDWKDHNYNGTYGEINSGANYSQKPDDWDQWDTFYRDQQAYMANMGQGR
jgi:hypothetical protein